MYFVIVGAALTGYPMGFGQFLPPTMEVNPRLIFTLQGLKDEALLLLSLIWSQIMTAAVTKKNDS